MQQPADRCRPRLDRRGRFPPGRQPKFRHDGDVLDHDHCYSAVRSRDRRFDGWFVTAVRTTGIYCRPSCPAITPKRTNVEFFPTAAGAQQRGFRACKRCRPDASPGSPEWNSRQDVVGRAMRLIADGVVDRDGVPALARRLGYSERHLTRLLADEVGAGPLAIARAQRAHTARVLIETSAMPFTDVAFAAGFGSIRQFNDTVQCAFATSPTALRRAAGRRDRVVAATPPGGPGSGAATTVALRLPTRVPFAAADVVAFVGRRAIPGTESFDGVRYRRTLRLPAGSGAVELTAHDDHVRANITLTEWSDLPAAVQRLRRLLDLDADPAAVDELLGADPALAALVRDCPGRRSPASVDPFETAVRAVIGQQVSVAGARTVAARIVDAVGSPSHLDDGLTHVFPGPEAIAEAPDDVFSMPRARRDTIRRLAAAVADGMLELHAGTDPAAAREGLLALKGIGPWTADYVVMRGLGHPDVFLARDLGVRHALDRLGGAPAVHHWAPWRSYAVHHLWASLAPAPAPAPAPAATMNDLLATTTVDSPIGRLTIVASDHGLRAVLWPDDDPVRVRLAETRERPDHRVVQLAATQLAEYFAGDRRSFDVPLDVVGTDFQRSAWDALRTIDYGATVSYGEQAARMGDRRKARAVGAANGRNPVSIVVPCHRVVGADGSLTGFAGGVETKAWLLAHERAHL